MVTRSRPVRPPGPDRRRGYIDRRGTGWLGSLAPAAWKADCAYADALADGEGFEAAKRAKDAVWESYDRARKGAQ